MVTPSEFGHEFWWEENRMVKTFAVKFSHFCRTVLCISTIYGCAYAASVWLSVCLSVSHSWILSKKINISAKKFYRWIN